MLHLVTLIAHSMVGIFTYIIVTAVITRLHRPNKNLVYAVESDPDGSRCLILFHGQSLELSREMAQELATRLTEEAQNTISWEEFMTKVTWEKTATGEIITENPEHIPVIERYLDARADKVKLKGFIEEMGGEWFDSCPEP